MLIAMWKCVKCCVEIRSVFQMLGFEVAKRRDGVVLGCEEKRWGCTGLRRDGEGNALLPSFQQLLQTRHFLGERGANFVWNLCRR